MSRTFVHKIEAKFNNGLIELDDIPENIRKKWDRHNFGGGKCRKKKKIIIEKQFDYNA